MKIINNMMKTTKTMLKMRTTQFNRKAGLGRVPAGVLLAGALVAAASCSTGYAVVSELDPSGRMHRTVYAEADSNDTPVSAFFFEPGPAWRTGRLENPVVFPVPGDTARFQVFAERILDAPDTLRPVEGAGVPADHPFLQAREHWERSRGLFYTRYRYEVRYAGIADRFPLPLSDYLTEKEAAQLLRDLQEPLGGMSGYECYYWLSGQVEQLYRWSWQCSFVRSCDLLEQETGFRIPEETRKRLLKQEPLRSARNEEPLTDIRTVAEALAVVDGRFRNLDPERLSSLSTRLSRDLEMSPYLSLEEYVRLKMPGKLVSTNAGWLEDGVCCWKVDGLRLLAGELVLEAESRRMNRAVPVILGGLLAVAGLSLSVGCRRKRCRRG